VVEERVESGSYATPDEVIRAGLLALEREEAGLNEWLTRLAEEALADPPRRFFVSSAPGTAVLPAKPSGEEVRDSFSSCCRGRSRRAFLSYRKRDQPGNRRPLSEPVGTILFEPEYSPGSGNGRPRSRSWPTPDGI